MSKKTFLLLASLLLSSVVSLKAMDRGGLVLSKIPLFSQTAGEEDDDKYTPMNDRHLDTPEKRVFCSSSDEENDEYLSSESDGENEYAPRFQAWMSQASKNRYSKVPRGCESESSHDESDSDYKVFEDEFQELMSQLSGEMNNSEKTKIRKADLSFVADVADWALPLSIAAGTAVYCVYNPKSIKESWEYIKSIPLPFVSLCALSSYIAFRSIQHTRKKLDVYSKTLLEISCLHTRLALGFAMDKVQNEEAQKETKKKCEYLEQKIKSLKEKNKINVAKDREADSLSDNSDVGN